MLLKVDQTLLTMETDNEAKQTIIHLAVKQSKTNIVRHLIGDPALFRLNRLKTGQSTSDAINISVSTKLLNTNDTID